ncbi:MAG: tRNA modification GTPase MnmE [Planctomycetota bacterium]|jgi:tRNA modification GTPase
MMARFNELDTIIAISSSTGTSLRSIVRLSGPFSWDVCAELFTTDQNLLSVRPVRPVVIPLKWIADEDLSLDVQLQFWPEGQSYTGQELVELHLTAPNPLAEELVDLLLKKGRIRPAEAGEFSLRAFLSGRIDLTRAEAISDIFQSVSNRQLEVAMEQLAGGLSTRLNDLRNRLLDLMAWIEANLDFVEESDVSPITRNLIGEELRGSAVEIALLAGQWSERKRTDGKFRVLLAGPPNAGKSALFNTLSDNADALVSPIAGTTRDYLETQVSLPNGQEFLLIDTAGLSQSVEELDAGSQILGIREQQLAGLILVCFSPDEGSALAMEEILNSLPPKIPQIHLQMKGDLCRQLVAQTDRLRVSSVTGEGIERLKLEIQSYLNQNSEDQLPVVATTMARTRLALQTVAEALKRAAEAISNDFGDEIVAMDLRLAIESLDLITGKDVTEETLDRVFSRFCIGK